MSTCKECLFFEACNYWLQKDNRYLDAVEGFICEHFKNRIDFFELPIKIGDTVYCIGKFIEGVKIRTVHHIRIYKNGVYLFDDNYDGEICEINKLEKIDNEQYDWNGYFLTEEKAKRILKEKTNENNTSY